MKSLVILIAFNFFAGSVAIAQENNSIEKSASSGLQVAPQYPGGITAFYTYITTELNKGWAIRKGRMSVTFIVEKDGTLSNIEIVNSLGKKADRKIKKIIAASPRWIPGSQNGKPIKARYTLPLAFN